MKNAFNSFPLRGKGVYILSSLLLLNFTMISGNKKKDSREFTGADGEIKLTILAPGHFHANLLQKFNMNQVNDSVFVYAPQGNELNQYISGIESYNSREENPTHWKLNVYTGEDFLQKMTSVKRGNVVVLAGNNREKTNNIFNSIQAGYNVLSDKPMAINEMDFHVLQQSYALAKKKGLQLYDIMTERYDLLNIIEKELLNDSLLFGKLEKGTVNEPAVSLVSVHHFYKEVSGKPLIRPAWYYDIEQQGEGIADVTTHLIDLVNWKCFPEQSIDYQKHVKVNSATHWPTKISLDDFKKSTLQDHFPDYLTKYLDDKSILHVMANGTINYQVNDVHIGIRVAWNYEAPEGSGDTHSSLFRGSKATIKTIQDKSQKFVKQLYVEKNESVNDADFWKNLELVINKLKVKYPFISFKQTATNVFLIDIPVEYREGHESHFKYVAEKFFGYLVNKNMPAWEKDNTLSKYFITTTAVKMANK